MTDLSPLGKARFKRIYEAIQRGDWFAVRAEPRKGPIMRRGLMIWDVELQKHRITAAGYDYLKKHKLM